MLSRKKNKTKSFLEMNDTGPLADFYVTKTWAKTQKRRKRLLASLGGLCNTNNGFNRFDGFLIQ